MRAGRRGAWAKSEPSTQRMSQAGPKSAAGVGTGVSAAARSAPASGRARAARSTHCPTEEQAASAWGSTGLPASPASFFSSPPPRARAQVRMSFSFARVTAT